MSGQKPAASGARRPAGRLSDAVLQEGIDEMVSKDARGMEGCRQGGTGVRPARGKVFLDALLPTLPVLVVFVLAALAAGCRSAGIEPAPQIVQPGPPGQAGRVIDAQAAADLSNVRFTEADVRFMQGMIGHHAQALEMTALIPSRTSRPEMKLLGQRIEISQADEIRMMQEWLRARGQEVPSEHAHHMHGATLMPGMLTQDELARLAAAAGVEFDRLFLEFMIKHHAGALVMVKELFATPGAGQDGDIFAFASDVEADQSMEIDRMAALLKELQQ